MPGINTRAASSAAGGYPQRGAVLIVVLWFVAIASVLAAVMAYQIRLNASAVFEQRQALQRWAKTLYALHAAEMELMLRQMPAPQRADGHSSVVDLTQTGREEQLLEFDGRELQLAYPLPPGVSVRIYDHAGKISLPLLQPDRLRDLLRQRLGKTAVEPINALSDAWLDWVDADDLKHANGAEKDYYKTLDPPYEPSNSPIQSTAELYLIKGFAEAFKGVDLDTVFTAYNATNGVNPNLASLDTLALLPGLDAAGAEAIVTARAEEPFKSPQDVAKVLHPDQFAEVQSWLSFQPSAIYTIAVQVRADTAADDAETDAADADRAPPDPAAAAPAATRQWAYTETVQLASGYNAPPKILMVNPYAVLPRSLPAPPAD